MNFLQLAQRLQSECGVSGANTTVVNATGEWQRICNWTAQAWLELQEANPEWEWMRKNVSFDTVVDKGEYTAAEAGLTDFGMWKEKSFRAYLKSAGIGTEQKLGQKDYGIFRDYYLLSTRRTTSARPTEITISPSKTLILGLRPNDVYVVSGEYYQDPVLLALDADTPSLPSRYHMAIVYKAMQRYAFFESAPEVMEAGKEGLKGIMSAINMNQLPKMRRGRSMI